MAVSVAGMGESRWVRIVGLVFALVGGAALGWVAQEFDQRWPPPVDRLWIWVPVVAVGTTGLTAGLIAVSIGFASTPVRADARYRQAMLLRLLAGNLAAPLIFMGSWADNPRGLGAVDGVEVLPALLVLAGGYLMGIGAWRLWRRSQRLMAISAVEAMATDPRPPVLYLRSFKDDGKVPVDVEKSRTMRWVHRALAATTPHRRTSASQRRSPTIHRPVATLSAPGRRPPRFLVAGLRGSRHAATGRAQKVAAAHDDSGRGVGLPRRPLVLCRSMAARPRLPGAESDPAPVVVAQLARRASSRLGRSARLRRPVPQCASGSACSRARPRSVARYKTLRPLRSSMTSPLSRRIRSHRGR